MKQNTEEILSAFLNVYWLRPETAMFRSIDVINMEKFIFQSPSLDLGCGDGLFSFIRAGGSFDKGFDVYGSVNNTDKFFSNIDVYDYYDKNFEAAIDMKPSYQIDISCDHKKNLLEKSKKLGLYREFIVADANKKLPFENNSFKTIFSNIIYWLNDPVHAFGEIQRIMSEDGFVCVMLPNDKFVNCSYYYDLYIKQQRKEFAFLEKLDRGRITDNIKHAKSYLGWKEIFDKVGLEVVCHKNHLSMPIMRIWDIGMRPFFPVLYKMSKNIDKKTLQEIKKEWIDICLQFLLPIVEMDDDLVAKDESAFHMFILKRKNAKL